ncbi:MAG: hypothetical protein P8R42_13610 [Candidatus Binatia bacterium]|nr:hypothetical protein [Candidatus Binatia bacterium]
MDTLSTFLADAADFEKTFADGDRSRLTPYFADDAIYRVESNVRGCELTGPASNSRGDEEGPRRLRSSSGDPDHQRHRRSDRRRRREDRLVGGDVHARRPGAILSLRGESLSRAHDGKIILLVDR